MNKSTLKNIETLIDLKCAQLFEESKNESIKAEDINAMANILKVYANVDLAFKLADVSDTEETFTALN